MLLELSKESGRLTKESSALGSLASGVGTAGKAAVRVGSDVLKAPGAALNWAKNHSTALKATAAVGVGGALIAPPVIEGIRSAQTPEQSDVEG